MKRKLIISATALIAILIIALLLLTAPTQRHVDIDGSKVGAFPICGREGQIELSPGFTLRVSTGTSISHITPSTLEWLRSRGCVTDSTRRPMLGRDANDDIDLSTRVYRINLPASTYRFSYDSLAEHTVSAHNPKAPLNYIRDVDVVIAPPSEGNVLGIDFLKRFVVEMNYADQSLTFHNEVPDGYELVGNISVTNPLINILLGRTLYGLEMKVDHEPYTFRLNSEIPGVALKLPIKRLNTTENVHHRHEDIVDLLGRQHQAVIDPSAWVEFGNRAGSRTVHYFSGEDEDFEINPLVFFDQDLVIDFANRNIYLRPFYKINNLEN